MLTTSVTYIFASVDISQDTLAIQLSCDKILNQPVDK